MLLELWNDGPAKFWPDAARLLRTINVPLFNDSYKLRHPFGIYNTSLVSIASRFDRAVDVYAIIDQTNPTKLSSGDRVIAQRKNEFLEIYRDLLYSLLEHLDHCLSIVKCFFPSDVNYRKDKRVKIYETSVQKYRDRIGTAVNAMKYNQNHLRMFSMSSPLTWTYGYFVEAVLPDGALGPNPNVHPNSESGYSFAYDFRLHFSQVYAISRILSAFVSSFDPSAPEVMDKECGWTYELARKIAALKNFPFPNEIKEPNAVVQTREEKNRRMIRVGYGCDFGAPISITSIPGRVKVEVAFSGDGVSRKFKMPYFSVVN